MTPPPIPCRQRPAIAGIWHFLLPLLLLLPATLAARQPWWNEEKIITGATPDDYAAANVGQLKNFASRAAQSMDGRLQLAGGSGLVITAMINGWKSPSSTLRDDYSALTLGQFKNVLQRFYDRLADVKGVPPAYPWDASPAQAGAADDYAIVNLGQLKRGFDFAIPILLKLSPHSNASIPPAVFEPVRARWLGLDIKPAGSSLNDLDGDGISNGEEYLRSPFPPGKALLDPDDLDGDRIPNDVENEYGLDPLNFEDALSDLDDDGLTNYEECVLLAAEYGTRPDDPLSISQHVDPQTGLPLAPGCTLTDGQLVLWRRDIARWDFVPGVVGSDGGSNIYPAQAPEPCWDWNDSDQDHVPDGYAAWGLYLSQNSLPVPTRGAAGDLDQDGLPDLWEHRYHLAYWNASDSGHTGGFRGDLMPLYPTIIGNTRRDRLYDNGLNFDPDGGQQQQMDSWKYGEVWQFLPAIQDPDSDHLPNYQEYLAGTSPWLADSDGDGVNDTAEHDNGSDPVDVNDSVPFALTITPPSAPVLIGDTFTLQALVTRFTPAQPQADQLVAFEILDGSSARISRGAGQPAVEGVDRRLTGADGRCSVSVIAPTTPGVLKVRIKADKVGAAQTVIIDVQEPEGPPPIVLHIQASTTYPVPENASVPIVVSRRQGGALLAEAGVEIQLTATHGSLGPPALPATPRTATLQTGADGTASITWQAPAVHLGQLTATLTATSPAVSAGGEAQAALPVVASRTSVASTTSFGSSKLNGSSGGYAGGSSGSPPTQPLRNTSAEAPPVLFTSVRARGGNFSGTDRPKLELDRGGVWKSYKRYVMPKEDEPGDPEPQEPQTAPDDGFDGDLDPKQKTDDPGDPRDSNARTKPWTAPEDEDESADDKHRDATEEEIGSGAAELVHVSYLEEDEDAVGVSDGPEDQESGRYTAFNKYHDLEPLFDPEDEGTPSTYQFNPGQLVSHIKKVEFGKSAAEHGWMGDGFMGVLPVSVGSRYTQEEKEVTFTWQPSREAPETESEEITVHTESASMSWKQVRLQADKAVKAPDGMSVTFLLVKSTFDAPPPGVEPPEDPPAPQIEDLGTITLTIPKGETISKKATSTGEASRFIKKESEGDIIDLRQETFTAGKEIVLDLIPIAISKVWSDQIADVIANGLPNKPKETPGFEGFGTGMGGKPYILMGVRADNVAYAKVLLSSPIGNPFQSKVLFRLGWANDNGRPVPANGESTLNSEGTEVSIKTFGLPADAGDCVLIVGYDSNSDRELSGEEPSFVPTCINYKGRQPYVQPYDFKIVTQEKAAECRLSMATLEYGWSLLDMLNAADLIHSFNYSSDPSHDSPVIKPETVDRLGRVGSDGGASAPPGSLSHPVGILFSPTCEPGNTIMASYGPTSRFSQKFVDSESFKEMLFEFLDTKKPEVREAFDDGLDDVTKIFKWNNFYDSLDFADHFFLDTEMFLALGKCKFDCEVEVVVHRYELSVQSIKITGRASDLYDFNYDGNIAGTSFVTDAAQLQAGYNTASRGGRVITTELNFFEAVPASFGIYKFF